MRRDNRAQEGRGGLTGAGGKKHHPWHGALYEALTQRSAPMIHIIERPRWIQLG
ncbi:MAG: hypothetical protein ACE5OR_15580 [bacterium]